MQALELLHSEFDIDLLLDINMPRLDGFGVLEVMKQRNWLQEIPVIITSSEDDESFIQKAYELGVTDYIRRPFNLTVTQRRVSNALTLYARQKHLVHLAEEQVYEHEKTNSAIINILSHIVESRNFESGTHILHVRAITDILLRQLVAATNRCPLSQADISMISTLSALHDIGKISIPPEILNKPGKLTREEFEIMKAHTTAGDELLQDMPVSHDDPLMRTWPRLSRRTQGRRDSRFGAGRRARGRLRPLDEQGCLHELGRRRSAPPADALLKRGRHRQPPRPRDSRCARKAGAADLARPARRHHARHAAHCRRG